MLKVRFQVTCESDVIENLQCYHMSTCMKIYIGVKHIHIHCKVVKSIDTFGCGCKQAKHYERSDKTGLMIRGGFVYY